MVKNLVSTHDQSRLVTWRVVGHSETIVARYLEEWSAFRRSDFLKVRKLLERVKFTSSNLRLRNIGYLYE